MQIYTLMVTHTIHVQTPTHGHTITSRFLYPQTSSRAVTHTHMVPHAQMRHVCGHTAFPCAHTSIHRMWTCGHPAHRRPVKIWAEHEGGAWARLGPTVLRDQNQLVPAPVSQQPPWVGSWACRLPEVGGQNPKAGGAQGSAAAPTPGRSHSSCRPRSGSGYTFSSGFQSFGFSFMDLMDWRVLGLWPSCPPQAPVSPSPQHSTSRLHTRRNVGVSSPQLPCFGRGRQAVTPQDTP